MTDDDVRTILDEAAGAVDGLGAGARVLLRPARPARRPRRDSERAARDGLHARPDGDAERRRRQVDDVPPDRARRARATRRARTSTARPRPLPARPASTKIAWPVELDARDARHLLHLYGSLAPDVLAPAVDDRVAPRAARSRPPGPARAGALRADARVGAAPTRTFSAAGRPAGWLPPESPLDKF